MENLVSEEFKDICKIAVNCNENTEKNAIIIYYINRKSQKVNMGLQILQEIEYARKMGVGILFPADARLNNNEYEISYLLE